MSVTLRPVRAEADILPEYRATGVARLLRAHNLGLQETAGPTPELVVGTCLEMRTPLRLPSGLAVELRTGAASLKRVPFDVSWSIGIAGATAIVLVGHDDCAMVGLRAHREAFVSRLVDTAGWERPAAEQHFDHWSDLFEVADPGEFLLAEAARLRSRYPRLLVAPLLLESATGQLHQVLAS